MNGQQNQTLKKPSRIFEIAFNRSKYSLDALDANQTQKDYVVSVRPPVGYCVIQTNFTNINMPLYAYDGLLSFVRTSTRLISNRLLFFKMTNYYLKSKHENVLNNRNHLEVPGNGEEDFLDDFHVDVLNVNSRKQFTFKIANPNPVDVSSLTLLELVCWFLMLMIFVVIDQVYQVRASEADRNTSSSRFD